MCFSVLPTRCLIFAFALFLTMGNLAGSAYAEESPAGRWRFSGKTAGAGAFIIEFKANGTGVLQQLDISTGKTSNPVAVKWTADTTTRDPMIFNLDAPRLDRKGSRMHLNDNGNLSIRGNTEGELWVVVPEPASK